MKFYTIYENTTGKIVTYGYIDDAGYAAITPDAGFTKAETTDLASDDLWYYSGGVLTARPDLSSVITITNSGGTWTADGSDTLVFSSLPNPTLVTVNISGGVYPAPIEQTVTDGTLSITTVFASAHNFALESFPYKDYSYDIEAQPA